MKPLLISVFCLSLGITGSPLNAQTESGDRSRVNREINSVIEARGVASVNVNKAREALRKASDENPAIFRALLFSYAATVALGYDKPTAIRWREGLDHILTELAYGDVRRPNGFDPFDVMAKNWDTGAGQPHVIYNAFDDITSITYSWGMLRDVSDPGGSTATALDTSAIHALNEYINLRRGGDSREAAFAKSVTNVNPSRIEPLRDRILYSWGKRLLHDYSLFEAGTDARNYFEAHHQYWLHKADKTPPNDVFTASEPLAMISRRIAEGIRQDQKIALIPINAVLDSALKKSVTERPPETPSFFGLENANSAEMAKLAYDVRDDPTTAATYRHRLAVLRAFIATIRSQEDRDATWGSFVTYLPQEDRMKPQHVTADLIVKAIEAERGRSEAGAYTALDGALANSQLLIH